MPFVATAPGLFPAGSTWVLSKKKNFFLTGVGILALCLMLGGIFFLFSKQAESSASPAQVVSAEASRKHNTADPPVVPQQKAPSVQRASEQLPEPGALASQMILDAFARFQQARSMEESLAILAELRQALLSQPEDTTAAAIYAFLRSREDTPTGLGFVVGPDGVLEQAPTMRTALMEILPALNPNLALEVAREVMDEFTTQDEYALSLRNMAWNDYQGDLLPESIDRFSQMLDREEWLSNPSAGFLEAFDTAVAVGNTRALLEVTSVVGIDLRPQRTSPLDRASFIAMDRIVTRDPGVLAEVYDADPAFLADRPGHRASMLSRLDVADADQARLLVDYLNRSDHGPGELEYFSDLFPNGNYIYGNRLITADEVTPSIAQRVELDRAILAKIPELRQQISSAAGQQVLDRVEQRLLPFVQGGNN